MKTLYQLITFACIALFFASCSQQLYSSREKVSVHRSVAKVQPPATPVKVALKHAELPATTKQTFQTFPQLINQSNFMDPVNAQGEEISPIVVSQPATTSVAARKASGADPKLSIKRIRQELKNLKNNLQSESNSADID